MVERGQPGHPTAVDKKGVAGQVEVAASGEQVLAEICRCEGSVGTCVRHHRAFAVGPHENDARARRPQRVDGEGALDAVALELGAPGPAEQVVAGSFGAVIAAILGTVISWPLFLLGQPLIVIPIFLFIVGVFANFGFRIGRSRRDAVLGAVGEHAGLAPRTPSLVSLPRLVDTSVAIDGRVLDVVRSGFLHGRFLVPQPVLDELQNMADSSDDLRRAKGRRGLDVLESLRREHGVELLTVPDEAMAVLDVDAKLVRMAIDRNCALLTFDTNLAKAASIAGVKVLNLHGLALALRPLVVVGDEVDLHLLKAGKEAGQAVGYLDDGTMVVTEQARDRVGSDCRVVVTSVLSTANGRLVFARPASPVGAGR